MKVERKEGFKPITITIESGEEFDALYDLVGVERDSSLEEEYKGEEDRIDNADDLGEKLWEKLEAIKEENNWR